MVLTRFARTSALIIGAAAYWSRPWSCWYALGEFSTHDNVPYANFDYHGYLTMIAEFSALLFAIPSFALARRIINSVDEYEDKYATSLGRATMSGSIIIALALAAPTLSQIAYLTSLPLTIVWPVLASTLFWMIIVFWLWIVFIRRPDIQKLAQALKSRAWLLSALIALPKMVIVGRWIIDPM